MVKRVPNQHLRPFLTAAAGQFVKEAHYKLILDVSLDLKFSTNYAYPHITRRNL